MTTAAHFVSDSRENTHAAHAGEAAASSARIVATGFAVPSSAVSVSRRAGAHAPSVARRSFHG